MSRDPPDDPAAAEAVWRKSQEELQKGWLLGPFSPDEIAQRVGPEYLVSRRFGVDQGGDVRVIDDYSQSMCNPAFALRQRRC